MAAARRSRPSRSSARVATRASPGGRSAGGRGGGRGARPARAPAGTPRHRPAAHMSASASTVTLRARVRDVSRHRRGPLPCLLSALAAGRGRAASAGRSTLATSWRELAVCARAGAGRRRLRQPLRPGMATHGTRGSPTSGIRSVQAPSPPRRGCRSPGRPCSRAHDRCVPVSLAVEVIDGAGHVYSEVSRLPLPSALRRALRPRRAMVPACSTSTRSCRPGRRAWWRSPNWRPFKPRPERPR